MRDQERDRDFSSYLPRNDSNEEMFGIPYNGAVADQRVYHQNEVDKLENNRVYENCVFDELSIKGKDFSDTTFLHCSFEKCDLTGTKFNACSLTSCNFSNAQIQGCNFFSATLTECKLVGLALSKVSSLIGTTFIQCIFDYSDLRGLDLSGMDFSKSSFHEADLSLANLEKTSLMNSRFTNALITGAKLKSTDFRGATLQGLSLRDLEGAILTPHQLELLAAEMGITVLDEKIV